MYKRLELHNHTNESDAVFTCKELTDFMVADHVEVERYRYVDHLTTNKGEILQTSSEITGRLLPYYMSHVGEMIFKLLPAGSITGAPKPKTVEIIA